MDLLSLPYHLTSLSILCFVTLACVLQICN